MRQRVAHSRPLTVDGSGVVTVSATVLTTALRATVSRGALSVLTLTNVRLAATAKKRRVRAPISSRCPRYTAESRLVGRRAHFRPLGKEARCLCLRRVVL